jgi:hypothetical protein
MSTASGIDDFSYGDIMEIPNEKLLALLQAVIDERIFPSKWLLEYSRHEKIQLNRRATALWSSNAVSEILDPTYR